MKKKMRYLIGSAGAVAPVLGLWMPTAAIAAAQAPARSGAKTVSLRLGAAASTSASPISNTGACCTGHTKVHEVFQGSGLWMPSLTTTFWYTDAAHGSAVCVGTAEGTWFDFPDNPHYEFRVRIYSGTGKHRAYSHKFGGGTHNYHTVFASGGVHQWFGGGHGLPVEVCNAWVYVGTTLMPTSSLAAGPQCISEY